LDGECQACRAYLAAGGAEGSSETTEERQTLAEDGSCASGFGPSIHETLREEILGPEQRELSRERALQKERGGEAREFEDDAQRMVENEIHQASNDVGNRRLHAIERALQKIREGTYGFSYTSGDPIPRARLESAPEAVLTVQEKNR
jgi:DnaK suppressor protein